MKDGINLLGHVVAKVDFLLEFVLGKQIVGVGCFGRHGKY